MKFNENNLLRRRQAVIISWRRVCRNNTFGKILGPYKQNVHW